MQHFFHLDDGEDRMLRDKILKEYNRTGIWPADCPWNWGDTKYQHFLLGFDVVKNAKDQFDLWRDSVRVYIAF